MRIPCKSKEQPLTGELWGIVGGKGMGVILYIYIFWMLKSLSILFLFMVIVGCYGLNRIPPKVMLKS